MHNKPAYTLLESINSPEELRQLPESRLSILASELRDFMIRSVGRTGGHLAASLGTVELTIALHYIFNTPDDRLVWDVGHQSYAHKILTGRREAMATLRQQGGISGFPLRNESIYDTFGVGHSSTSISAALGMAIASKRTGHKRRSIAVIGDGAMTAGMAFEALNHAGDSNANLLVVLNDNDMSISPNVGGLSNYLGRVISNKAYINMREGGKRVLKHLPSTMWTIAQRAEEHMKGMFVPGTLFEELGFNYIGPVDGHNLHDLTRTLKNISSLNGPILLHTITQKGKGYAPAEEKPVKYHGVTAFDPATGKMEKKAPCGPTYTEVFGTWLCDMAESDDKLFAITPAMREGSGMVEFEKRFPAQYADVGIAEQHAVTFAAGVACEGLKPVVAIYSTFLQRGYDQVIHDVALQNLPVMFAIDRAGLVGADGATHAGSFDYAYLRCLPNMVIMAPSDANECRDMLYTAYRHEGPCAVRYPRGAGPEVNIRKEMNLIPLGSAHKSVEGENLAILSFGSMLSLARDVAAETGATVVDMRFVKPLDENIINELALSHKLLITLEEGVVSGGAGSAVNEYIQTTGHSVPVMNLGLPDKFIEHGNPSQLLKDVGLDKENIILKIERFLKSQDNKDLIGVA